VRPPPFAAAASGALYTETIRTAVLAYKFRADLGVLPLLRQALQRACESPALAEHVRAAKSAGAVVPVPLHPLKRWMRGRDPILELAQEVSTSLDVPLLRALKKVRWTPSQARLSRDARRRNLRGAFRVRSRARVPESVILVDDVLTTATTVARCARELRRAGARRVVALTVARSGAEG
jgi:ComF family protein